MLRRNVLRALHTAESGQPCWASHPHLFGGRDEPWPGVPAAEFAARRRALAAQLPPHTAALIPAYRTRYASRNAFHAFRQSSTMLYLAGMDEPDGALLVDGARATLYVAEPDAAAVLWDGPRCGPARAPALFGVDAGRPFAALAGDLAARGGRAVLVERTDDGNACALPAACASFPTLDPSLVARMRLIKSAAEQRLVANACRIGSEAMVAAMRFSVAREGDTPPGGHPRARTEGDVAARFEYEACLRGGAPGGAYVPVAAAGPHAATIHYTRNDAPLGRAAAPLFLLDAGARVHGYCSDVTRTWPLARRFAPAQRELYAAVLRVHAAAIARLSRAMAAGEDVSLAALGNEAAGEMAAALGALGFRNAHESAARVFPHAIGHHLGLDVHDGADAIDAAVRKPLRPGNVVTVEPGAYVRPHEDHPVRFHGIGVRIEDDVLLAPGGLTVLTDVPRDPDDIEALLASAESRL